MPRLLPDSDLTPADLHSMPDGSSFELVRGKLVERITCPLSSLVEAKLCQRLTAIVEEASAGWVWTGRKQGYRCFADDPDKVRRPGISYVHGNRFSQDHFRDGFLTIRPDLVVDVVSEKDFMWDLDTRVEEFLAVNVPLVWVINPLGRLAMIHRKDGSIAKLLSADALTGEDILPGFCCRLADIIPAQ